MNPCAISILCSFIIILTALCNSLHAEYQWNKISRGIAGSLEAPVDVVAKTESSDHMFVSANNKLYVTWDRGQKWILLKSWPDDQPIHKLLWIDQKGLIVAVGQMVWFYHQEKWEKLAQLRGEDVLALHYDLQQEQLYLGSSKGLYRLSLKGGKVSKLLSQNNVQAIAWHDHHVWVVSEEGLFKTPDSENSWSKVHGLNLAQAEEEESEWEDVEEQEEGAPGVHIQNFLGTQGPYLYWANPRWIIRLLKGTYWEFPMATGLPLNEISGMELGPEWVISSNKGVFIFHNQEEVWKKLYRGLPSEKVLALSYNGQGALFAATEEGIFELKWTLFDEKMAPLDDWQQLFKHEPSIKEVQRKAIWYAEVNREKIEQWRKDSKKKALWPNLSLSISDRRDTTQEIYTSATTSYAVDGPDDDTRTWSASLSWDLADYVYSSDQTSIDSRSRLMVQLREDVLDEVTRIYFERRRNQLELWMKKEKSQEQKINQWIRIEELTAYLDGFTGGWFSQEMGSRKQALLA